MRHIFKDQLQLLSTNLICEKSGVDHLRDMPPGFYLYVAPASKDEETDGGGGEICFPSHCEESY